MLLSGTLAGYQTEPSSIGAGCCLTIGGFFRQPRAHVLRVGENASKWTRQPVEAGSRSARTTSCTVLFPRTPTNGLKARLTWGLYMSITPAAFPLRITAALPPRGDDTYQSVKRGPGVLKVAADHGVSLTA